MQAASQNCAAALQWRGRIAKIYGDNADDQVAGAR
jgi:hypothetical protein